MKTRPIPLILSAIALLLLNACSVSRHPETIPDLNNTVWKYSDSERSYEITLKEGGIMKNTHPNDRTPDNDRWEQKGKYVYLYFNDRYATYEGTFHSADQIRGKARNIVGKTWNFRMKRK